MTIDWELTADWDLKIGDFKDHPIIGIDQLIQHLKIRLQFFLGELYFDTTQGVAYYKDVLKKGTTYDEISGAIKLQIVTTEHIIKITSFSIKANENNRAILISFTAQSDFGDIILENFGLN